MTRTEPPPARRRTRGRRSVSVVAALCLLAAAAGLWVLLSHRGPSSGGAPAAATDTSGPVAPSSSPAPASSARSSAGSAGPAVGRLVTPSDLAGIGLTVGPPESAQEPALGPLCGSTTWAQEWSSPAGSVGQRYPATGVGVSEHLVSYAAPSAATSALARLQADASACPAPAQGGSVQTAGTAAGLPGSVVFQLSSPGRDGVIDIGWIVVAPHGDTLVEAGYTTQQSIGTGSGPGAGGGDDAAGDSNGARATAESLARLAVDRLTTGG